MTTACLSRTGWLRRKIGAFAQDESGATAIEYGLIAACISIAIISTLQGLGTNLKARFSTISTALK